MPVHPERGPLAVHQHLQAAGEGRRQQVTGIAGMHRARGRGVVGDHHSLAVEGLGQHRCQPAPAGRVQPGGVLGREAPAPVADDGKIRHPPACHLHGEEPVGRAEQGEVGPQDTAQKAHAVDDHRVIVEDVDILRCLRLQLIDQPEVVMVELVVARHVDYRPVREAVYRPAQAIQAHANIARQDHHVGIGCRRREILELGVQVIQDVESHQTTIHQERWQLVDTFDLVDPY